MIELELDEYQAELIAADITYLLAHTKTMAAVVKSAEAPFAIKSRERLEAFINQIKEILHDQGGTAQDAT